LASLIVEDTSLNGTYINDDKCLQGVSMLIKPKDYVNFIKSHDEKEQPNIGFRFRLASDPPVKFEDHYVKGRKLGEYFPTSWASR